MIAQYNIDIFKSINAIFIYEQLKIEIIKGTIYVYTENTKYLDIQLKTKQNKTCAIYQRQFSHSVVSDSLRSMDCIMPGFPVHHQLPELTQTHVHCISDAIQPSHPIIPFSSCLQSFPASLGLFQGVRSLHQVAKVLEFQLQHYSKHHLKL